MSNLKGKKGLLDISEGEDEDEGGFGIKINEDYAKKYSNWRGLEEMQKLKDRYGDNEVVTSSSESSEDEDLGIDQDKDFLKTLSLLKEKDPIIYKEDVRFFKPKPATDLKQQQQGGPSKSKKLTLSSTKKDKIFSLKDHERETILHKVKLEDKDNLDEEEDNETNKMRNKRCNSPSYLEQQAQLKSEFSKALGDIDSDDEKDIDTSGSGYLKKRVKTAEENEQEKEDYRLWLQGQIDKLENKEEEDGLHYLKQYWTNPKLDEGEKFLRDYILKQKYADGDADGDKGVPTYEEIVHDSDDEGLSGDERRLEEMEKFEHKYNFRFEEPDQEFIKSYPRTVQGTLRRQESKRKEKRDEIKDKKTALKEKKREEIQRLKALKRKEIMDKLEKLVETAGDTELQFSTEDLEGDFDPEAHDLRMKELFKEFEGQDKIGVETEKPTFPYDEEIDEPDEPDYNDWDPDTNLDSEDQNENKSKATTTTNIKEQVKKELIESSSGSASASSSKGRGRKRRESKFLQAIKSKKPKFDPKQFPSYQEYFDEYYKLDFEDLIGGEIPCRFKYRNVVPNDFGLSTDELLKADDKELNQWASLKKSLQYRDEHEEKREVLAFQQKSSNIDKKKKVLPSLFKVEEDDEDQVEDQVKLEDANISKSKKRRDKKKNKKKNQIEGDKAETNTTTTTTVDQNEQEQVDLLENPESKKRKKKGKKQKLVVESTDKEKESTDEPLSKKSKKSKKVEQSSSSNQNGIESIEKKVKVVENKKKKRHSNSEKKKNKDTNEPTVDDERLKAYGINPNKFKHQQKYGKKANSK